MTTQELIARLKRRIADFDEATMQLESMTYSKVDAELDAEIAGQLEADSYLLRALDNYFSLVDSGKTIGVRDMQDTRAALREAFAKAKGGAS